MAKILVEDPDEGTQVPFLRGILTRSLQNSGLPFEQAYQVASEIRRELENTELITTVELRDRTLAHLKAAHGAKLAMRYQRQSGNAAAIAVQHPDGPDCVKTCHSVYSHHSHGVR